MNREAIIDDAWLAYDVFITDLFTYREPEEKADLRKRVESAVLEASPLERYRRALEEIAAIKDVGDLVAIVMQGLAERALASAPSEET
jgi:hypothetical protein